MRHFRLQSLITFSADTTHCSRKGTFYVLASPVTGFPSTSREGSPGCWNEHWPRNQKIQVSVSLGWLQTIFSELRVSFWSSKYAKIPIQSILINSGIPYLRTQLLANICNPHITIHGAFIVLHTHGQIGQQSQRACYQLLVNKDALCLLVSPLLPWTSVLFTVCLLPHFPFSYFWFFLMISLFKMAPKCSADLLSSAPSARRLG